VGDARATCWIRRLGYCRPGAAMRRLSYLEGAALAAVLRWRARASRFREFLKRRRGVEHLDVRCWLGGHPLLLEAET